MKLKNFIFIAFLIAFASCSSPAQKQSEATGTTDKTPNKKNVLIVYLTRTGNTEAVAKMIREDTGGELVALELENPYPQDYQAIVKQVDEENERNFLPALKTKIENIQKYQTIFLGFPTWDMQLPPPLKSFLKQYDLSGKIVIPFNTNAGYGAGSSFGQVRQLCPECTILEGFEIKGGIERDGILFVMEGEKETEARLRVKEWLRKLKMLQ